MPIASILMITVVVSLLATFSIFVIKSGLDTRRFLRDLDKRQAIRKKEFDELMERSKTMSDDEKIKVIRQLMDGTYSPQ